MQKRLGITLVGVLALLVALSACSSPVLAQSAPADEIAYSVNAGRGVSDPVLLETAVGELSEPEQEGLLYMREEEKLARDVYLALYEEWGMQVFSNIASSESTHMEAIKTLLDRYGLEDPAAGKAEGEYTNEELQALYDQLVADGSESLAHALQVGAAIEEIDILDLEAHMAQTDKADILRVYDSLMRGSRNHLRAFVSSLERQGVVYEPQYLSSEAYDEIVNSETEQGGGPGGQGSRGEQTGRGGQGGRGGQSGRGQRGS